MANEIDNKIVRMEFDNKQFEKRVSTSLTTIEKLKKSLNFDEQTKSLNLFQKSVKTFSIDDIGASLEKLEHRFSGFGIVGMTVIQEMTKSVLNLGKTITNFLLAPLNQMKSGGWSRAMNIKDAEFAMKGLGIVGDKLTQIKDDINYAVSGTAYGYDAAAKAASQFAASNVQIGDSMKLALRAVSGVAAQTNSSYEEISGIFTTVAANGKLMTQQLRQLSFRGLNASATLAKSLGTSEATVNKLVSEGKISFEEFAKAMDDAFGEHATAANETFTGALSNMKAALSRIGANFADPLMDAERDVFNATRDILNSLNSLGNTDIFDDVRAGTKRRVYLTEAGKKYQAQLEEALKAAEKDWDKIDKLQKQVESQAIENAGAVQRMVEPAISAMETIRSKVVGILQDPKMFEAVNNITDSMTEVVRIFKEAAAPIKNAWRQIFPKKETDEIARITEKMRDFLKQIALSEEYADDVRHAFMGVFTVLDILKNVAGDVFNIVKQVGIPIFKAFMKVAGMLGEALINVRYGFSLFTSGISYTLSYFKVFTDLGKLVANIFKGFGKSFKPLGNVFKTVGNVVLTVLCVAFESLLIVLSKLAGIAEDTINFFSPLANAVGGFFSAVGGLIASFFNLIFPATTAYAKGTNEVNQNTDKMRRGVIPTLTAFVKILSGVVTVIRDVVVNGINFLSNAISNFSLTGLLEGILGLVGNIRSAVASIPKMFSGGIGSALSSLSNMFSTAKTAVADFFGSFNKGRVAYAKGTEGAEEVEKKTGNLIDKIKDFFKTLEETDGFKKFAAGMEQIITVVKMWMDTLTPARLMGIAFIAVVMIAATVVYDLIKAFTGLIANISGAAKAIGGVGKSISGFFDALKERIRPSKNTIEIFKNLAISIAILAGSMKLLSTIETDKILPLTGVMLALMAALTAFAGLSLFISKRLKGIKQIAKFMAMVPIIMAFAGAMIALAASMKILDSIQPQNWGNVLAGMALMLVELVGLAGVVIATSRLMGDKAQKGLFAIIAFSGSLYFMAKTIQKLQSVKIEDIGSFIVTVGAAVGAIIALSWALSKASPMKAMATLIMTATMLLIAVPMLKKISTAKLDGVSLALLKIVGAVATIAVVCEIIKAVTKGNFDPFSSFSKFAGGMVAISASLILITANLALLGRIDKNVLDRSIGVLWQLTFMLGIIEGLAYFTKDNEFLKFATGLLVIVGSLAVVIGAIAALGLMDRRTIDRGLHVIGWLTAFIGALEVLSGFTMTANGNLHKILTALAVDIFMLSACVIALSFMDPNKSMPAVFAIGTLMLALAASFRIIVTSANEVEKAGKCIALMIVTMVSVGALTASIAVLSKYPWQNLLAAAGSLAALMVGIGVALFFINKAASNAGDFKSSMAKLIPLLFQVGILVGGIYAISVAVKNLAQYPPENVIGALAGFALILGSLTVVVTVLSAVPWEGGIKAAFGLLSFVAVLVGGLAALNGLFMGVSWLFTGQSTSLGDFIGGFVGDIVNAFREHSTASLPEVADNLSVFAEKSEKFFSMMADVDTSKFTAVSDVCMALTELGAANYSLEYLNTDDFSSNLTAMMTAILDFQGKTGDLDFDAISTGRKCADQVFEMIENIPKLTGVFGNKGGDLLGFNMNLPLLGDGLKTFADNISGIKEDGVDNTKVIMEMVSTFVKDLPSTNNWGIFMLTFGMGDDYNKIAQLSHNLPALGEAMYKFAVATQNIPIKGASITKAFMEMIAAFAGTVSGSKLGTNLQIVLGGFGFKIGNDVLSNLSQNLPELGKAVYSFAHELSGLTDQDASSAESGAKVLEALANISVLLKDVNGTELSGLALQLEGFSASFTEFINYIISLGEYRHRVENFIAVVDDLVALANRSKGNIKALSDFGDALSRLYLPEMNDTSSQVVSAFSTAIDDVYNELMGKSLDFTDVGAEYLAKFLDGFGSQNATNRTEAVDAVTNAMITLFEEESRKSKIRTEGYEFAKNFSKGITSNESLRGVKDAVIQLANTANTTFKSHLGENSPSKYTYQDGLYFIQGFTNAIKNTKYQAEEAGADVGAASLNGLTSTLRVASPSKETIKVGENFTAGEAKGATSAKSLKLVTKASGTVADTATGVLNEGLSSGSTDGVTTFLGDVASSFTSGSDTVASAAQSGVDKINSILSGFGVDVGNFKFDKESIINGLESVLGTEYASGLKEVWDKITHPDSIIPEDLYKDLFPKDVLNDLSKLTEGGISDAIANGASAGGKGGSGGSSGASKWGKKDVNSALQSLKNIFNLYKIEYDAFNEELLKKGKVTTDYLVKSFQNNKIRNAVAANSKEHVKFLKQYAKELKEADPSLSMAEASEKATREYVHKINKSWKSLKAELTNTVGKGTTNHLLKTVAFTSAYMSQALNMEKQVSDGIKHMSAGYGTSLEKAKDYYQQYGEYLYHNTDEYKENTETLKELDKERQKLEKKAKAKEKIIFSSKSTAAEKEKALAALDEIEQKVEEVDQQIAEIGYKSAAGPAQMIANLRDQLKELNSNYLSIGSLEYSKLTSGFDKISKNSDTAASSSRSAFDIMGVASTAAASVVSEAFDVMNASYETGINLLERFSKVGKISVRSLMKRAQSQLKAFQEFQNGIAKMRSMGFADSLIKDMEDQGPQALNYIRGFLKMSSDQVAEYNSYIDQQKKYEGQTLSKNLDREKTTYEKWTSDIESLASRGLSQGIIDKLKSAGVSQADFVSALTSMDDSSLHKVADYYANSVSSTMTSGATTGSKDFLSQVKSSVADYEKWLKDLDLAAGRGIGDSMLKSLKDYGYQNRELLDWIISTSDSELSEFVELYNKYFSDASESVDNAAVSIQSMIEGVKDQTTAILDWFKILDDMRDTDKRTYKALVDMGFESGYAYAKAWNDGDEAARKELEASIQERDRANSKELRRSLLDRSQRVMDYTEKIEILSKQNLVKLSDSQIQQLSMLGPEGADKIDAVFDMYEDAYQNGSTDFKDFVDGWTSSAAISDDQALKIVDALVAAFTNIGEQMGAEAGENLTGAIKTTATVSIEEGTVEAIKEASKTAKKTAVEEGTIIGKKLAKGTGSDEAKARAKKEAKSLCGAVVSEFGSKANKLNAYNAGIATADEYLNGVKSKLTELNGLISKTSKSSSSSEYGENVVTSFGDSLTMNTPYAVNAATNFSKSISEAVRASLQIHSPSRVFADMGENVVLGFAKGIEDTTYIAGNAVNSLTDTAFSNFDNFNSQLNSLFAARNQNGIITPTLDLSQLHAQIDDISALVNGVNNFNVQVNAEGNKEVVSAIRGMEKNLYEQLGVLGDRVDGMQVVMDSGALVGSIATPMNNALGTKRTQNRRGM